MVKAKKLGLAGLVLAGSLNLFNASGCGKDIRTSFELPNGYNVTGLFEKSVEHKGSYNVFSDEADLEEKSRTIGEITYLGFAKNEDTTLSINNINQNARSSGLISGKAENNTTVYDNMGVILKIKTDKQEYIFNLKTQEDILPPSIILEKLKKGDKVSIPTIRMYERAIRHSKSTGYGLALQGYRVLNEMDYIYLHEIGGVN